MSEVFSFGGGVQSVAIAALVVEGRLPRFDRAVIADSDLEATSTWEYLDRVVNPRLGSVGLVVEVAPHSLATVGVWSHQGRCLLPVFSGRSMGASFCSGEWKKRVVDRWIRSCGLVNARRWIGFSTDERRRAEGASFVSGHYFPLLELGFSRDDCLDFLGSVGWPLPLRSSCVCCPFRSNDQWRILRDRYPADFAKAIEVDEEVRNAVEGKECFLHSSRAALSAADLEGLETVEERRGCWSGQCDL